MNQLYMDVSYFMNSWTAGSWSSLEFPSLFRQQEIVLKSVFCFFVTFCSRRFAVFVRVVKYLTSSTQLLVLYYRTWLHVSTSYKVILRPLVHIKTKLQLQILFSVRMRSGLSAVNVNLLTNNLDVKYQLSHKCLNTSTFKLRILRSCDRAS
jgi:hypothetical protein